MAAHPSRGRLRASMPHRRRRPGVKQRAAAPRDLLLSDRAPRTVHRRIGPDPSRVRPLRAARGSGADPDRLPRLRRPAPRPLRSRAGRPCGLAGRSRPASGRPLALRRAPARPIRPLPDRPRRGDDPASLRPDGSAASSGSRTSGSRKKGAIRPDRSSPAEWRSRSLAPPNLARPRAWRHRPATPGLALAVYAARHGLRALVAFPEDIPPAFVRDCRFYGAEVIVAGATIREAGCRDAPPRRPRTRGGSRPSTYRPCASRTASRGRRRWDSRSPSSSEGAFPT